MVVIDKLSNRIRNRFTITLRSRLLSRSLSKNGNDNPKPRCVDGKCAAHQIRVYNQVAIQEAWLLLCFVRNWNIELTETGTTLLQCEVSPEMGPYLRSILISICNPANYNQHRNRYYCHNLHSICLSFETCESCCNRAFGKLWEALVNWCKALKSNGFRRCSRYCGRRKPRPWQKIIPITYSSFYFNL